MQARPVKLQIGRTTQLELKIINISPVIMKVEEIRGFSLVLCKDLLIYSSLEDDGEKVKTGWGLTLSLYPNFLFLNYLQERYKSYHLLSSKWMEWGLSKYVSPFSVFHLPCEKENFGCTLCEGAHMVFCIP